jgi:hypothetical protein
MQQILRQTRRGTVNRPSTARWVGATALWVGLGAGLGLSVAGCSGGVIGDTLPTIAGGLPSGVPDRPKNPGTYPNLNNKPSEPKTEALSDAEQLKLEQDLAATRDRQGALQDSTIESRGAAAEAEAMQAKEKADAAARALKRKKPPARPQ